MISKVLQQLNGRKKRFYGYFTAFSGEKDVDIKFRTFQIWSRGQGGVHAPPEQLIFESEESFGVGSNVQTILYNKEGEVHPFKYCIPSFQKLYS